jgi:hypothetical protein
MVSASHDYAKRKFRPACDQSQITVTALKHVNNTVSFWAGDIRDLAIDAKNEILRRAYTAMIP